VQPSASASSHSLSDGQATDAEDENDLYSFMEEAETSGVEISIAKQVQFPYRPCSPHSALVLIIQLLLYILTFTSFVSF